MIVQAVLGYGIVLGLGADRRPGLVEPHQSFHRVGEDRSGIGIVRILRIEAFRTARECTCKQIACAGLFLPAASGKREQRAEQDGTEQIGQWLSHGFSFSDALITFYLLLLYHCRDDLATVFQLLI